MAKKKGKFKQNKTMVILLFPVLAVIFLIGWAMYWIGDGVPAKESNKKTFTSPKKDHVHFMPNMPSTEKQIITE